jgi:hypothetical protein
VYFSQGRCKIGENGVRPISAPIAHARYLNSIDHKGTPSGQRLKYQTLALLAANMYNTWRSVEMRKQRFACDTMLRRMPCPFPLVSTHPNDWIPSCTPFAGGDTERRFKALLSPFHSGVELEDYLEFLMRSTRKIESIEEAELYG